MESPDTEEYDVELEQLDDEPAPPPAPEPDPEFTDGEVADMTQGMGPDPEVEPEE